MIISHGDIKITHNHLVNNKLTDQAIIEKVNPDITTIQFISSPSNGPIKSEANNTWPISRKISERAPSFEREKVMLLGNYNQTNDYVNLAGVNNQSAKWTRVGGLSVGDAIAVADG